MQKRMEIICVVIVYQHDNSLIYVIVFSFDCGFSINEATKCPGEYNEKTNISNIKEFH